MNERTYKYLLVLTAIVCITLAGALGYVTWEHSHAAAGDPGVVAAQGPDPVSNPESGAAAGNSLSDTPLAPLQLSPQRLQAIGVTTALVERKTVSKELRVPGNVDVNERRLAYVQTRFPGWIQRTFANATYQYVRKGQPLFTIYSPELVSTEQEYLLAKQNQQTFSNEGHGSGAQESQWLLQAAAERLRQFGVPASEVARLEQTATVEHDVAIESPSAGYITDFNALPNQYAQAETRLYTIADLSSVWVYANIYQTDIGQIRPGTPAKVTVDAYPGRTFRGLVDQVLPQVDPVTRTTRVRFVFNNPGIVLKPGMYVNVSIELNLGRQLVIPASGALQAGTREIAFIDRGNGYLEPREIELGPQLDDHVVVLKGLHAGERIVSSANFLIDSESQLQAAMGSFTPPPPPPPPPSEGGAAAQTKAASRQISIDFSSEPSPPHKGNNRLQVKLTGADGKPVTASKVTVTFYMPAMPAMGMAATKKVAALIPNANGTYEGQIQLPNGGTYQVTILAQANGQTIATRQLSISATGGM